MKTFIAAFILFTSTLSLAKSKLDIALELISHSCNIELTEENKTLIKEEGIIPGRNGLMVKLIRECKTRDQINYILGNRFTYILTNISQEEQAKSRNDLIEKNEKQEFNITLNGYDCAPITCKDYLKLEDELIYK